MNLNVHHGGLRYLYLRRSRGFRWNPNRENDGQYREESFTFFVETTNRPPRNRRMYSPIPKVIWEDFIEE